MKRKSTSKFILTPIFIGLFLSCDTEVVDMRSTSSTASKQEIENKSNDLKTEEDSLTEGGILSLTWDKSTDIIESYTLYAGLKGMPEGTFQELRTIKKSEIPGFDQSEPKFEIPLSLFSEYKGLGEICITITANNSSGKSAKSNSACGSI
jgi:hypothetical protein